MDLINIKIIMNTLLFDGHFIQKNVFMIQKKPPVGFRGLNSRKGGKHTTLTLLLIPKEFYIVFSCIGLLPI